MLAAACGSDDTEPVDDAALPVATGDEPPPDPAGACLEDDGVEVFNAGVVSYQPAIYWRKIRHLLQTVKFRFDEAVVFIDISDIFEEHDLNLATTDEYLRGLGAGEHVEKVRDLEW